MPRKAPTPASTTDYRHDATRLNNPPAGLADIAPLPASGRTRYAYDPQLVWAGKAEHLTFDVETVPLHIHERIAPAALIDVLRTGPAQRSMFADAASAEQIAAWFLDRDYDSATFLVRHAYFPSQTPNRDRLPTPRCELFTTGHFQQLRTNIPRPNTIVSPIINDPLPHRRCATVGDQPAPCVAITPRFAVPPSRIPFRPTW